MTSCEKVFHGLRGFLQSLPKEKLTGRDGQLQRFLHWCTKLQLDLQSSAAPKLKESEQRAAIRGAFIAMPDDFCSALPGDLLDAMDGLLQEELRLSTVTEAKDLPQFAPNLILWQGDMSHLHADALVNPANGDLLGCFLPTHKCLDNILHAQAGPRLRIACADMKRKEGLDQDANGKCRVTAAFALPAKYVFHTVGPCLVEHNRRGDPLPPRAPTTTDVKELKSCYVECLNAAASLGAESLAFCCISTGVFGYPGEDAARLALKTVKEWMDAAAGPKPLVIFNVFLDKDLITYQRAIQEVWPKLE